MSLRIIDESRQNLLFAFRQLVRQRTFTVIAVLTLALGIGFTTAIFSVVHAVVLRPLPVPDPDRLVVVNEVWRGRPGNVSAGNFVDWRAAAKSFESLAAAQYSSFNLADTGTAERVIGARVTAAYFDVFATSPMRGRVFTVAEDEPGREQLVVLSHRLWARRFGGDPAVVGKEIRMNGRPYSVLGIMPPSFDLAAFTEELWVPVAFTPERKATHDEHYLTVYAKLRNGVTRQQAQGEMEAIAADLSARYPRDNAGNTALVQPLMDVIVGGVRQRLLILFGAVAFVLLIACTNVANLLLARGSSRSRELAVRSALGAGRARLVGQLLTESLVLGGVGALVGLALARWGIQLLITFAPAGVPRLDQATIDAPVLVFALGIALASSLIFGLAPALRASRTDLQGSLKDGARQVGASLGQDRVRAALVAVEVALAVLLLVGAGLLIRTAIALQSVHPGFEPGGVISARLSLPAADYAEPARVIQTFQRVVEETRQLPGVELAAAVTQAPLSAGGNSNGLIAEGRAFDIRNAINSRLRIVTLDYFRTLRVPIVEGRGFTDADRRGAPKVMIVSQELARVAWPGQSAIGKRMACCEGGPNEPDWKIVVGVAGDVRSSGLAQAAGPEFYLPVDQVPAVAWDWIQRTMCMVGAIGGKPERACAVLAHDCQRHRSERADLRRALDGGAVDHVQCTGAVQHVDVGRARRGRARPGGDRDLRGDRLFRGSAVAGNWRSDGTGRVSARRCHARGPSGNRPGADRRPGGSRCLARAPRCDERAIIRRVAARPGHARHRDGRARHRVVAGEHHPGPARGADRSCAGAEGRVTSDRHAR